MSSRRGNWSLAGRLTVWYALSSFALILVATGYLYWALATNLDRENDRFLADQALPLVNLLRDQTTDRKSVRRQVLLAWSARPDPNVYFRVLDEHQQIMTETPAMGLVIPRSAFLHSRHFDPDALRGQDFRAADERPFRILAVQTGPAPSFTIQVAMDRSQTEELLANYRVNLMLVLGAALVVCCVVGHRIARRGIRPVQEIAATAGRIRSSTLNQRIVGADLPAELRTLADTFNDMLDRLESSFARLAQFAADIAHELRTPINNLRGEAEVALSKARTPQEYQDLLGSALEEHDRLTRLIDSLLFLARAENPAHQIRREPVDVGQELDRLREFYEAAAAESGVCLSVACPEKLVGQFDRTLLQRALGNLVSNALRHTPTGGKITLSARNVPGALRVPSSSDDSCLQIEVADTGTGIAPEHLPHVFDRFYRADATRNPGTEGNVGLGLAIVKKIAELHGGSVAIDGKLGSGTTVTLSLP